jgi:hypothetical protein
MRGRWRPVASASNSTVEVARYEFGGFAIRNSAFRARTVVMTKSEFRAFIHAVKSGAFDDMVEEPR